MSPEERAGFALCPEGVGGGGSGADLIAQVLVAKVCWPGAGDDFYPISKEALGDVPERIQERALLDRGASVLMRSARAGLWMLRLDISASTHGARAFATRPWRTRSRRGSRGGMAGSRHRQP